METTKNDLDAMVIGDIMKYDPTFFPTGYEKCVERVPGGWIFWILQDGCGVPAGVFVPKKKKINNEKTR